MGIMYVPYNRQNDPRALFAQGFQNMLTGILQGQKRKGLANFASSIDPDATPMQVFSQAMASRLEPQEAMGLASFQQSRQPKVGSIPYAATQMSPAQIQNWLDNYGRGVTVNTGERMLPEKERLERARIEHDKAVGKTGPGFGPGDRMALSNEIDARLKSIDKFHPGWKDFSEADIYDEWLKFIELNPLDNDDQRRSAWALWKEKVNKKGAEVDWDPTDPKWLKAIGLTAEPAGAPAVMQGAVNEPDFDIDPKTGGARMVFNQLGEEVGIKLKNGKTFKVGNTMKRGGFTYKYIGDNKWQRQ